MKYFFISGATLVNQPSGMGSYQISLFHNFALETI